MHRNSTIILATIGIGFLALRGAAAESDWPRSLYLPGITVSSQSTGKDTPAGTAKKILARCDILLWVTDQGLVRIAQVIKSTGYARLDDACLHAAIGQKMDPAQGEKGPVASWAILPVSWDLSGPSPKPPDRPDLAIAPLAPNQVLKITAADYPKGALQRSEQGNGWVHVEVSDTGAILDLKITQSSGSPELDQATLAAVSAAHFSPAFSDHKPVNAAADVVIAWVLPASSPATPSIELK